MKLPCRNWILFAQYEFNTPYQLVQPDCESVTISELLKMAGVSLEELGKKPWPIPNHRGIGLKTHRGDLRNGLGQ